MYIGHGHFVPDAAISSGTLRTQDLLRSFGEAYVELNPFNGRRLRDEAYDLANALDEANDLVSDETAIEAAEMVNALQDELNHIVGPYGYYFGSTEGDGACFGFWKVDDED